MMSRRCSQGWRTMKKVGSGREGSDLRGIEGHHASEDKKGQRVPG